MSYISGRAHRESLPLRMVWTLPNRTVPEHKKHQGRHHNKPSVVSGKHGNSNSKLIHYF